MFNVGHQADSLSAGREQGGEGSQFPGSRGGEGVGGRRFDLKSPRGRERWRAVTQRAHGRETEGGSAARLQASVPIASQAEGGRELSLSFRTQQEGAGGGKMRPSPEKMVEGRLGGEIDLRSSGSSFTRLWGAWRSQKPSGQCRCDSLQGQGSHVNPQT